MSTLEYLNSHWAAAGLRAVAVLASFVLLDACDHTTAPVDSPRSRRLDQLVEQSFDSAAGVPGLQVAVHDMRGDFSWSGAAGDADPAQRTPLRPEHPFRIASVTKTFVAAAILRLNEQGRLGLDDAIERRLSPATSRLLRDDGYDLTRITIRHLLNHTSGIWDFVEGEGSDYLQAVLSNPSRRWTRADQIQYAMDHGAPLGSPGAEFHYSDTGYLLAGEILENATGTTMARALRTLLDYERLGLHSTYVETVESPRAGATSRAHQFAGDIDVTNFDPSFDLYGGGGLVSTTADLVRFYSALLGGRVFERSATLTTMLTGPIAGIGLGLFQTRIGGFECWGHAGFWGDAAYACDSGRLAFAFTLNQAMPQRFDADRLAAGIIETSR